MEKILCAAILYDVEGNFQHQPKNINYGFVICGHRHHNCIATIAMFPPFWRDKPSLQGFLTSEDRFVSREEAWGIAVIADQIIPRKNQKPAMLFSEDLY